MDKTRGEGKGRPFFEGWYLKHQNAGHTIAFIPGISRDESGRESAFLQVITDETSCSIPFPYASFRSDPRGFALRVGGQLFSGRGVRVDLTAPGFSCRGAVRYGPLTPLQSDIMGPFRFVPFLECRHGVISMKHSLNGSLEVNGVTVDLNGGTGYIEKDRGSSFPSRYLWVQCNRFSDPSCSVMTSIARIPLPGFSFTGCIAAVCFRGREYRLATYSGAHILWWDESGFLLWQKDCMLEAELYPAPPNALMAPRCGTMARTIRESTACRARFRFFCHGSLLFDLQSGEAGFEYDEESEEEEK